MPTITLSEALDNLYTTTWQNMKDTAIDNVFNATPFWFWLKDKNKLKKVEGGRWIGEPIIYDDSENIFWVKKGSTTALNDYEFMTTAKFDWRYLAASMVRFGIDDQQNRGKNMIMNWMNAKLENTQQSLITTMETTLFAGSGAATDKFDGLQWIVANDPTSASNTVGGIDPSQFTAWRNQYTDRSGLSFATTGVAAMRTLFNNSMNNRKMDAPDLIITTQTIHEWYEDTVLPLYRIQNNKLGDMGFENIQFKGMPMVWSPSCPSGNLYMLNTNFLYFVYDPMMFFDMTEWKSIPNQVNDRAAQIITAGQLVTNRRRTHGVMFNQTTA